MNTDRALAWGAEAIASVYGLDPSIVRLDTPLAALGVDALGRVCIADYLDALLARAALGPYDDRDLEQVTTVRELIAPLLAAGEVREDTL